MLKARILAFAAMALATAANAAPPAGLRTAR